MSKKGFVEDSASPFFLLKSEFANACHIIMIFVFFLNKLARGTVS
jgi:hypothetical protein